MNSGTTLWSSTPHLGLKGQCPLPNPRAGKDGVRVRKTAINLIQLYREREYCRNYYKENREDILEYKKKYYEMNKEVIKQKQKIHRDKFKQVRHKG